MGTKQWLKQQLRQRARRRDLRWRQLPEFGRSRVGGAPRVFYFAPEENTPSGGVRVIYRHVDHLNEMGINASVVHSRPGFRCSWFENSTRVVAASQAKLSGSDILVLPEYVAPGFGRVPQEVRLVVFNQGPHHTFDGVPPGANPYENLANLEAILTISDDGHQLLSMAFPSIPVHRVRNVIDPNVFHPGTSTTSRQVAYVPSRRNDELAQLLHVLLAQPEFRTGGWTLIPLHGLSENAMAESLRNCSIFISLSDRDGFGLPPAEAMASGAYVVGHHGGGGREFFDKSYCTPAHDNTALCAGVLAAIRMPNDQRAKLGHTASRAILERYSYGKMREDLARFYGGLL